MLMLRLCAVVPTITAAPTPLLMMRCVLMCLLRASPEMLRPGAAISARMGHCYGVSESASWHIGASRY